MRDLTGIKNVVCPICGYQLDIIYDEHTEVKNILVHCKGRHCGNYFNLNIKHGIQQNLEIDNDTIEAFKIVFGDDWEDHIRQKFGYAVTFEQIKTD